jgi:dihydrolipoamide dehydrogenase
MSDFDVVIIGAGPAGFAAAMTAAERGARVAVVEAERPGGACVHHACIPTNILLDSVHQHLSARELDVLGLFKVDDQLNYARAAARKDGLVRQLAGGIEAALKIHKITVLKGHGSLSGAGRVSVSGTGDVSAEAVIVATGARWEAPSLAGIASERVLTPDLVQSLITIPASACVLGGSAADTAFALEYAVLFAAAGSRVTLATPQSRLVPALDEAIEQILATALTEQGIALRFDAAVEGGEGETVRVRHRDGMELLPAEVVVAADPRRVTRAGLNLEAAGIIGDGPIAVDGGCRAGVEWLFAAGDISGGAMLSNAAAQMGEVAGINATGGEARTRLGALPALLHTLPAVGWIGLTEREARRRGYDVRTGISDLSTNARAVALGAREGVVKVVTEAELGEVLGVHALGPGVEEVLAAAATVMQAELTVQEVASTVHWHPSIAESLAQAARRALQP